MTSVPRDRQPSQFETNRRYNRFEARMDLAEAGLKEGLGHLASPAEHAEVDARLSQHYLKGSVPHIIGRVGYLTARFKDFSHQSAMAIALSDAERELAWGLDQARELRERRQAAQEARDE